MSRIGVFVSHVTVEARFADFLSDCLKRDFIGLLELFVSSDSTSIPVGTDWFEKVLEGIANAQLQLVICSPDSVKRPWIHFEVGAICMRGVEVVPLCHSGIAHEQLPVPLSQSEGLVLTQAVGLRKLYARIAAILSSDIPNVQFESYAERFQELETEYSQQRAQDAAAGSHLTAEAIVENPRVVCVTSEQFIELGYRNQLDVVLNAFPQDIQHSIVKSRRELENVMMSEQVDILHIAAFVCPRTGQLYFSDVQLSSSEPVGPDADRVEPEALAMLVQGAHTRLVVIAGGDSLAFVTALLNVTNVIAPREMVSAKALAVWVQAFYDTLRMKTLAESCAYAAMASQVPMRLLMQQVDVPEISFRQRSPGG